MHEALDILRGFGVPMNYMRVRAFRSAKMSRRSSPITACCSSSSRIATRSCARC
ncbi:MAG: hypothetical protein R3E65_03045 [Steroidobacteraceae bacterium]